MNLKRTKHARASLVLLGALCAVAITACGSSSSSSTNTSASAGGLSTAPSNPEAPITINVGAAPESLDPTETGNDVELGWDGSMYSTLLQYEHTPGPIPGVTQTNLSPSVAKPYLAQSWQFTNGDRTLTFHLRPGLKFPSGDPVDAAAVKFSLERAIKVGSGGDAVCQETQFKPALDKSIEAPNPTTVVINYSRPAPNQLDVLSSPECAIYDPKVIEEHGGVVEGKPNTWLSSHDAGYGPYLLKSYSAGHQMVLEENPNFFEPPKTKHITINFIPDNETLILDAKSGAADVTIGMSEEGAHSISGESCCTVIAGNSRRGMFMNLPQFGKVPVFDNPKSRAALAYAVPYPAILAKVAYGYGQLYGGPWQPSWSWYEPSVGKPHEYNLTKAKELLAASGVKTPVTVPIYIPLGEIINREVATAIAGEWEKLGVHAKIEQIPVAEFFEEEKKYNGASIELEGPEVVAPAYFWAYELQCEPKNPDGASICLPEADKLMTEVQNGAFIGNPTKEREVLNKVDELYIQATAQIWVYNSKLVSVLSKDMTNYYSSDIPEPRFYAKS
jgi:peptide/nickel transport system substrate-binding protein